MGKYEKEITRYGTVMGTDRKQATIEFHLPYNAKNPLCAGFVEEDTLMWKDFLIVNRLFARSL